MFEFTGALQRPSRALSVSKFVVSKVCCGGVQEQLNCLQKSDISGIQVEKGKSSEMYHRKVCYIKLLESISRLLVVDCRKVKLVEEKQNNKKKQ